MTQEKKRRYEMVDIKELKKFSQNLSVLYVEDDSFIGKSMMKYLNKFFLSVVYAEDGLEGIREYKKQKFDIVITDLSMPNLSGLEMIDEIKSIDVAQAILITTAHSESHYIFEAIRAGIDGYIIKPFDMQQLNYELYKIVTKIKNFRENEEYKRYLNQMIEQKTAEISRILQYQSNNYEKTLLAMVEMIEQRDTYTAGHSKRVANYSKLIAQEMNLSEDDCELIYQASIMHDIGKIATPDSVLLNPNRLNSIEYILIQEHVSVGYKLLKNIPMFSDIADIIYAHHEKYDGDGYPRGLRGDDIPLLARIMIVADTFDAMTTSRIYKARKTNKEALDELISLKDKQFHSDIVDFAIVALKDIDIDESINQLPKTRLEEERFAYFYKDTLGVAYNQNYLDVVLMKNSYDKVYRYIDILYILNFSQYNKKFGWNSGDKLLHNIEIILSENYKNSLVFRIYGDDFAVLSKEKINFQTIIEPLELLIKDTNLKYITRYKDLTQTTIDNSSQIERV